MINLSSSAIGPQRFKAPTGVSERVRSQAIRFFVLTRASRPGDVRDDIVFVLLKQLE